MDPLEIKKQLFGEMGQYAKNRRMQGLRQRYQPAKSPQVAPVPGAPTNDDMQATIDSVQMPPTDGDGLKSLADLKSQGAQNMAMADDVTSQNKSVLDGLSDDELLKMLSQKY